MFFHRKIKAILVFFLLLETIGRVNVTSIVYASSNDEKETEQKQDIKFKLGFEFQEVSHLCPWNSKVNNLQDVPLFLVKQKNRKLWHVVIDTYDVEFVTNPFSYLRDVGGKEIDDSEYLETCMRSISTSINLLKKILLIKDQKITESEKRLKEEEQEIFLKQRTIVSEIDDQERESKIENERIQSITREIELLETLIWLYPKVDRTLIEEKTLEEAKAGNQIDLATKIQERNEERKCREIIQKKIAAKRVEFEDYNYNKKRIEKELEKLKRSTGKVTFQNWFDALNDISGEENLSLEITPEFELVKAKDLVLPQRYEDKEFWEPMFAPQSTIQHPLAITIPLYFSLFILDDYTENKTSYRKNFARAIPNLDLFKIKDYGHDIENLKANLYTPLNGLIFLHASTVSGMFNSIEKSDAEALKSTLEEYKKYEQIDVKMNLSLMSRRSFSQMFEMISPVEVSFSKKYAEAIIKGNSFFRDLDIANQFYRVNYGEQFFDEENEPRDLTIFSDAIQSEFYKANKDTLRKLLKKGIISTAMLRNFKKAILVNGPTEDKVNTFNLLQQYFEHLISSVDNNPKIRYIVKVKTDHPTFIEGGITSSYTLNIQHVVSEQDVLSPPWFLELGDSMGKYSRSKATQEESQPHEELGLYGEALVETRKIEDVSPAFMKGYPVKMDNFLKNPRAIEKQAVSLFYALQSFQRKLATDKDFLKETLQKVLSTAWDVSSAH